MFLVRDIMYCKPGQARPMIQKFLALSKLGQRMGLGAMRVMTDVSAERYWTIVSEMEVKSLVSRTRVRAVPAAAAASMDMIWDDWFRAEREFRQIRNRGKARVGVSLASRCG